jgi:hypothetical protein
MTQTEPARNSPNLRQGSKLTRLWPALAIAAAVLIWGSYIAIGAATHETKDVRKASIIFGCTMAFLLFWFVFLFRTRTNDRASVSTRNPASVIALAGSLLANVLEGMAFLLPAQISDLAQGRLLVSGIALAGLSLVAAVVGLSRPDPQRGKMAGCLAVLLVVTAVAIGVLALKNSARATAKREWKYAPAALIGTVAASDRVRPW